MKFILFSTIYTLIFLRSFGQNCKEIFEQDKFTKDRTSNIFFKGIENIKPFVRLEINIRKDYPDYIRIQLHAGNGNENQFGLEDYENLTLKYISSERNSISLYLLFEDDKSFQIFSDGNVMYNNSVFIDKSESNVDLLSHLKNQRVIDIRFEFNNIKGDFSVPDSQQDYFKQILHCLKW